MKSFLKLSFRFLFERHGWPLSAKLVPLFLFRFGLSDGLAPSNSHSENPRKGSSSSSAPGIGGNGSASSTLRSTCTTNLRRTFPSRSLTILIWLRCAVVVSPLPIVIFTASPKTSSTVSSTDDFRWFFLPLPQFEVFRWCWSGEIQTGIFFCYRSLANAACSVIRSAHFPIFFYCTLLFHY